MVHVTLSFYVQDMNEVTEAMFPIAQQLQTVTIMPVGHSFVKNMANEKGSTVHMLVELVEENEASMLNLHKPKKKELVRS